MRIYTTKPKAADTCTPWQIISMPKIVDPYARAFRPSATPKPKPTTTTAAAQDADGAGGAVGVRATYRFAVAVRVIGRAVVAWTGAARCGGGGEGPDGKAHGR